jgi:hypothetical protein
VGEHTTSGWAEHWSGRTVRWAVACALAVAAACAGLLVSGRFGPGRGAVSSQCGAVCESVGSQGPVSQVSVSASGQGPASGSASTPAGSASSPGPASQSGQGPGHRGSRTPPATSAPKAAPSPAPPAASSSAPVSASALVQFKVTSHWDDGYRAAVTITDTGAVPLTGWHLTFHVTGAQLHQPTDTGETAMAGDVVTITPADWRQPLTAGAPAVFGMEFDGVLTAPGGCALDGVPCVMQYVVAVPGQ